MRGYPSVETCDKRGMATNCIDTLENLSPQHERRSLLASGSSERSTRRPRVERCFRWTNGLCGIAFLFLGICILSLGIVASDQYSVAYIIGGATELLLGASLLVKLLITCKICPTEPSRNVKDTTSCVLFTALAFLFLVWCTTVCSYCAAIVLSGMKYKKGDSREIAAMTLSAMSLVLEFVYGAGVCYWVGCPTD